MLFVVEIKENCRTKFMFHDRFHFAYYHIQVLLHKMDRYLRIMHKDGWDFMVCKRHELIAILIAFSCILLIKDEQVSMFGEYR